MNGPVPTWFSHLSMPAASISGGEMAVVEPSVSTSIMLTSRSVNSITTVYRSAA